MKLLLTVLLILLAAPAAAQDVLFTDYDETSIDVVDHSHWDKLLAGLVLERDIILELAGQKNSSTSLKMPRPTRIKKGIDINYVPYEFIKTEYADVLFVLQLYVDQVRQVNVSRLNRDEQLAYWLNLRNALVVLTLFTNYPVSKTDLQSFYKGESLEQAHFDTKMLWVEGRLLSIRDIEENIILANWPDPRVLYGFYYGAKGGPFIMKEAFTGDSVYQQLEKNAQSYLNASNTIHVSRKSGIKVPLVFSWHGGLFDHDPAVILSHLEGYAETKLKKKLAKAPAGAITYVFDWALNDIPDNVNGLNVGDLLLGSNTGSGCFSSPGSACDQNLLYRPRRARVQ